MSTENNEAKSLVDEMNESRAEPFTQAETVLVAGSLFLGLTLLALFGWFLHR